MYVMKTFIIQNKIKCCFSKLKSEVYTDASFMHQKRMAIGIWSKDFNINSSYKLKGYPDSNRAELGAIFGGMLYIKNKKEDVNILTDSLTSLRLISGDIDCKNKFKILVDSINYLKYNWKGEIIFTKVKAHSKNIGNNNADLLAKIGNNNINTKTLILPDDIIDYNYNKNDIEDIIDIIVKTNNILH